VIDHFTLYVFNNIQLPPNCLEEAGLGLKSATGGLNEGLNDKASGATNYKPNSFDGLTECPSSQESPSRFHTVSHTLKYWKMLSP